MKCARRKARQLNFPDRDVEGWGCPLAGVMPVDHPQKHTCSSALFDSLPAVARHMRSCHASVDCSREAGKYKLPEGLASCTHCHLIFSSTGLNIHKAACKMKGLRSKNKAAYPERLRWLLMSCQVQLALARAKATGHMDESASFPLVATQHVLAGSAPMSHGDDVVEALPPLPPVDLQNPYDVSPGAGAPTARQVAEYGCRPVVEIVPKGAAAQAFMDVMRPLFLQFRSANAKRDDNGMTVALARLLGTPAILLQKGKGGRTKRKGKSESRVLLALERRLNWARRASPEELSRMLISGSLDGEPALHDDILPPDDNGAGTHDALSEVVDPRSPPPTNTSFVPSTRNVLRASKFVRAGMLGRACMALTRKQAPPLTANLLRKLEDLHPSTPPSFAIPPLPPSLQDGSPIPHFPSVSAEEWPKLWRKIKWGASGGPSAATKPHLDALASDPECLEGMKCIVGCIADGTMPDAARPYLLASSLFPGGKEDGGVRPVAAGEIFYRAGSVLALMRIEEEMPPFFKPMQYGVGVPGGVEMVAKMVQLALGADLAHGKERVGVLKNDFRNGFNEVARDKALAALFAQDRFASIWRLAHWSYGLPSDLWVRSNGHLCAHLLSKQGVRQGDPLGNFLFCLAVQPIYTELLDLLNQSLSEDDPDRIFACAFIDDLFLVGRPERLAAAFHLLKKLALKVSLHLKPNTSVLVWPHASPAMSAASAAAVAEAGFEVRRGALLAGIPVGAEDAIRRLCAEAAEKNNDFFDALRHPALPAQSAMLMLRQSGVPRLVHLLRTVSLDIITPIAHLHDQSVLYTALSILGLDPTHLNPMAIQQIMLPVRLGGLGLRSQVMTAPLAYAGGLARTSEELLRIKRGGSALSARCRALDLDCVNVIRECRKQLPEDDQVKLLPSRGASTLTDTLTFFLQHDLASGLQHLLTGVSEERSFQATLADAPPRCLSRLKEISSRYAGMWLTTLPLHSALSFSNVAFTSAVRTRLGLAPLDNMPPVCSCGADMSPEWGDPQHFLSCTLLRKGPMNHRHDAVAKAFGNMALLAGASSVDWSSRMLRLPDGKKLDMCVFWLATGYEFDVSVRRAASDSGMQSGSGCYLHAMKLGYDAKVTKYRQWFEPLRPRGRSSVFSPLIFTALGALDQSAVKSAGLIGDIASGGAGIGLVVGQQWTGTQAKLAAITACQVALLSFNLFVASTCAQDSVRAAAGAGPGRPLGALDRSKRKDGSGRKAAAPGSGAGAGWGGGGDGGDESDDDAGSGVRAPKSAVVRRRVAAALRVAGVNDHSDRSTHSRPPRSGRGDRASTPRRGRGLGKKTIAKQREAERHAAGGGHRDGHQFLNANFPSRPKPQLDCVMQDSDASAPSLAGALGSLADTMIPLSGIAVQAPEALAPSPAGALLIPPAADLPPVAMDQAAAGASVLRQHSSRVRYPSHRALLAVRSPPRK